MAIDMIATTTANIHDLDAEINVIRERIKQGIAMTEGELDVYQPNVVRRETLHDQLTTMRVVPMKEENNFSIQSNGRSLKLELIGGSIKEIKNETPIDLYDLRHIIYHDLKFVKIYFIKQRHLQK
ncbi:unnamed protein product [Rotaria socialis]|uniref:Uncharacterized protein n=2 Tax=Rotaria socialis TaxID=392032 RepID=A0A818IL12_9BILA|nr:unnamed protein product [Rotaria socialis]